jgi:hypothetical protein
LQTDGWTDPSSGRFFNVLFVGPLSFKVEALRTNSAEFYIFSFRISCLRELAATIVNEIKAEVQSLEPKPAVQVHWTEYKRTGITTYSPNVMRSACAKLLEDNEFSFAYGCASHWKFNLTRDALKLPGALSALSFVIFVAKTLSPVITFQASFCAWTARNRRLSRRHSSYSRERDGLGPPPCA